MTSTDHKNLQTTARVKGLPWPWPFKVYHAMLCFACVAWVLVHGLVIILWGTGLRIGPSGAFFYTLTLHMKYWVEWYFILTMAVLGPLALILWPWSANWRWLARLAASIVLGSPIAYLALINQPHNYAPWQWFLPVLCLLHAIPMLLGDKALRNLLIKRHQVD